MNTSRYPKFEFKEHTADVLIVAYGSSLEELFENAAQAVFEVMTDTSKVMPRIEKRVEETGFDLENLLYRWLESLLVYYDAENLVFGKFKVYDINKRDEDYVLSASAWGEEFDERRHERRTIVKAITYAQMEIKKENNVWKASFVVDI